MIQLTLPWPPSVNHYYRRVGTRTLISKPGRQYRKAVVAMLRGHFREPMRGRLQVTIHAHPPDRRRRDLLAVQHVVIDRLQCAKVFRSHCNIESCRFAWCIAIPQGCLRLSIHPTGSFPWS